MTNSNAKARAPRLRDALRRFLMHCRLHWRSMLKWAVVVVIAVELGGIWNEVHHIRNEQVKSEWYALTPDAQRIVARKGPKAKKLFESSSNADVEGSVSIDNEPVEVEIDR